MKAAKNRWTTFLLLMVGLALVACTGGEQGKTIPIPGGNLPSSIAIHGEPPASISPAELTASTNFAPQINIKTDRGRYKEGESIIVTIENNASNPIHFGEICSLNLCFEKGEDWICEERECDGPTTALDPGSRLEILQEAKSIDLARESEIRSRYKLDYQIISEDPFYFARSIVFAIQSGGINCKQAKQIALEHARSSPHWNNLDASRAIVRWYGENMTCVVDFAWQGAEQIRTGLWAEGYSVIVSARSGQIIEASPYER